MKIETTWEDLKQMPWQAIFWCAEEYKQNNPNHNDSDYTEYMKESWGIDHSTNHAQIVDEQKYLMFVLRWA
jgi:outer membrane protein assembly factor BamD (BamD/ComL family)